MELSSADTNSDSGMTQYLTFPENQYIFRKYLTTEKKLFFCAV